MLKNRIASIFCAICFSFAFAGCNRTPGNTPGDTPVSPDFSAYKNEQLVVGAYIGHARRYAGYDGGKAEYSTFYPETARAAGVNTIFGIRLAQINSARKVQGILQGCEENGVKALLSMQGLTYPDDVENFVGEGERSPAFLGYDFWDEPGAAQFAALENSVKLFKQTHPDKNAFINLLPSYASAGLGGQLQAETYESYVQQFVTKCTSVSQVSVDHYPLIGSMAGGFALDSQLSDGWLADLECNALAAKSAGKDFWCYTQGMAFGDRRVPESAACLTFQNYVSMAYGVKGLAYFCLDTPGDEGTGGEFAGTVYGMIDRNGQRTEIFEYVKKANEQLHSFGYAYKQFSWENCMPVKGSLDSDNRAFENLRNPLVSSEHFTASANHDTLVGTFKNDDYRAYLVVPFTDTHLNDAGDDFMYADTSVTLTFKNKNVLIMGNGSSMTMRIPDGMLTLTLRPGECRFVIPFD